MPVTNRRKRLLLGYVASRPGGRVTAGRNESLLRRVFEITAREAYAHERVGELYEVFMALESDGDLVLERDEYGKLFAAHLADDVDLGHADFESDMFDSHEELWLMLVALMSSNARLRRQIEESGVDAALELAMAAESHAQVLLQQLEAARGDVAKLSSQAIPSPPQQLVDVETELAAAKSELATTQSRLKNLIEAHELATKRWASEKKELRDKLSQSRNEAARLRMLNAANEAAV